MSIRIRERLRLNISHAYGRPLQHGPGWFYKGNQEALASKLTPKSNDKRLKALFRAWGTNARCANGEKFVTANQKRKKAKRQRVRLRMTVAKEQREIQDLARKGAEPVMKRLYEIATSSMNETAAIAASQVILERAYGKANQTNINATVDANGKPTEVSGKELDTRITQALKRVEDLTGGTAKAPARKEQPADVRELDRDPDSPTQH